MFKKISLFLLTASVLFPQEKLTLDKAIELGLQNNYSIQIAKNEAAVDSNNFSLGNAGFLPTLDVTGAMSKSSVDTKQQYSSGSTVDKKGSESKAKSVGVSLNWTLFDGFNMFISYSKLKQLREIGEMNAKAEIENSVAKIIETYYNIVSIQLEIRAVNDAILISRERVKIAEDKYNLGAASKLEVLQAKVDLNADISNLLQQQLVFNNAKVALNEAMGRQSTVDFIVNDSIVINKNLIYDELKNKLLENNSSLMAAGFNKEVASLSINGIRSQMYPQISAYMNYNYSKTENQAGFFASNQTIGLTYGLSLSLNLFDGLNTYRKIENAKVDLMNSELQFKDTKNKVEANFEQEFLNYKNAVTLVNLEEENLNVAQQNVDIAMERFRNGSYTPLELREAQKTLLDAQIRLVNAQYSAKSAEVELRKLSGQIIK